MKYIANIHNAREVCLVGAADLGFWNARLASQKLLPFNVDGQARIRLSAVHLKWMGITFQEFSVAVELMPAASAQPAICLVSAFSTSRCFAWCERTMFQTPYQHANVIVRAEPPWSFELRDVTQTAIIAQHSGTTPTAASDDSWAGRIYLPRTSSESKQKYFCACLSGPTQVASFDSAVPIHLQPLPRFPVIQLLADSHFYGLQWRVRPVATHARSKTYVSGLAD